MKKNSLFSFLGVVIALSMAFLPVVESSAQERLSTRFISYDVSSEQYYAQQGSDWWNEFKKNTVVSTGTNGRLDLFLQKLNRGEHVIVVANGGSITEGSGSTDVKYSYADRFVQGLKNRYPNAQIEYLNVGISAQPSGIGIMNYDRDVTLALGNRTPDLVLIDYAVNDFEDNSFGVGYESMIRKVLEGGDTAVMLVMAEFKNRTNLQEAYIPLGNYYGLPMMSIKNALDKAMDNGLVTESQFFADDLHPSDYGHLLMAEGLLEVIDEKQLQINTFGVSPISAVPQIAAFGMQYTNLNSINSLYELTLDVNNNAVINYGTSLGTTLNSGSFSSIDTQLRASRRFGEYPFAYNFMHDGSSGNEAFTLTTVCKNILINYKTSGSSEYGNAIVMIDDKYVCTLQGYDRNGYNNSTLAIPLNSNDSQLHTLKIYMEDGTKKFTIYNIAYTP